MRVGVFLPNYGPMATADFIRSVAHRAEVLGYDSLAVCDHILMDQDSACTMTNVGNVNANTKSAKKAMWFDAFSTLAYVAAATKKIRLVTNVYVLPLRNPLLVAREATTIDVMSGGRLIFGVGTGWYSPEFEAMGISVRDRGRMTDEALQAIKTVWTKSRATFNGKYFRFGDVEFYPKPVQKPHPPIWVGGFVTDGMPQFGVSSGDRPPALVRTVQFGDGWIPCGATVEEVSIGASRLNDIAREAGKNPKNFDVVCHNMVCLQKTIAEAKKQAAASLVKRFGSIEKGIQRAIVGNQTEVVRRMETYLKAGGTYFLLGFFAQTPNQVLAAMDRFSHDILPSFS